MIIECQIQSNLIKSKSQGPSEYVRLIRGSTHQRSGMTSYLLHVYVGSGTVRWVKYVSYPMNVAPDCSCKNLL